MRPLQPRLRRRELRPRQRRRLRLPLPLRGGRGRELAADPADHRVAEGPLRPDLVVGARRAPGSSAVDVEARLRNDAGHEARLSFLGDGGAEAGTDRHRARCGDRLRAVPAASSATAAAPGSRRRSTCAAGGGCPASDQAKAWVRSVQLTVVRPPAAVRRARGLAQRRRLASRRRGRSAPSPPTRAPASAGSSSASTAAAVPADADRSLRRDRRDRRRSGGCGRARRPIAVEAAADTAAPPVRRRPERASRLCLRLRLRRRARLLDADGPRRQLARPSSHSPTGRIRDDPELIRAAVVGPRTRVSPAGRSPTARWSGGAWRDLETRLVGGELQARVDSSAERPGAYVFRAVAADRAGNLAMSARAAPTAPTWSLDFPLRERTRLRASVGRNARAEVGYGSRPRFEAVAPRRLGRPGGRRRGRGRRAVRGRAPSLEPVGRTLTTDGRGRVRARLVARVRRERSSSAGTARAATSAPSRRRSTSTSAARPGSTPFRATSGRGGGSSSRGRSARSARRCRRASSSSFRSAAVGHPPVPHGRPRVPDRRRGHWRMRYRFDRFYAEPTRFRFRLRVAARAALALRRADVLAPARADRPPALSRAQDS